MDPGRHSIPAWYDGEELIELTCLQGNPIPSKEYEADIRDRLGNLGTLRIQEMERLKGMPPEYTTATSPMMGARITGINAAWDMNVAARFLQHLTPQLPIDSSMTALDCTATTTEIYEARD